jgi:AcrR family transcriptional regulator
VPRAKGTGGSPRARRELPTHGRARSRSGTQASRELRARGKRTMRQLLDAGVEVFASKGYFAARVDDIVKLAETSHGTFYLYFANKEDLFRALAAEVSDEMQTLAESLGALEAGPAGTTSLREWIARFAELYEHYGPVIRAWTEAEMGSHEFGRLGNDVLARFTRVLTERISEAAPPDLDPVIAALALVAMLERLNYYALAGQVHAEREDIIDTLALVTQRALFGSAL